MGDKSDKDLLNFWFNSNSLIYNGYGPTETTIGATMHRYTPGDDPNNIGKPFDNYNMLVLDSELKPVSKGEVGELYIGGVGVAKGYLNLEEVTKNKFLDTEYGRVYKTGDLVKFNDDNDIIFIGRADNQIKINGVRIEMEEIENLAITVPNVLQTCVTYNSDKKLLTLYYVGTGETFDLESAIKHVLKNGLPRAVVPKGYVRMEKFTLNHNGKIDKKILPLPVVSDDSYVAPTTHEQKLMIDAYKYATVQKDSNLDDMIIGIQADYFEIGGESLKIQLVVKYLNNHSLTIDPLDVFKYPKICDLVNHLKPFVKTDAKMTTNTGRVPLTPTQLNLWHYQKMYPDNTSYVTTNAYRLKNVNLDRLWGSLQKLVNQNDSLRTRIVVENNVPIQTFDDYDLGFYFFDVVTNDTLQSAINDISSEKFDIENSILIRYRILKIKNIDEFVLVMVKHNIITDAYSENVMLSELRDLYNNDNASDVDVDIASEKLPFESYVRETIDLYNKQSIIDYWTETLKNSTPSEFPRSTKGRSNFFIKKADFIGLNEFCKSKGITVYNVMMCALNIAMWQFTGCTDVTIGTQVADRSDPRWSRTVGFMVHTLFDRNVFNPKKTVVNMIDTIRNNFLEMMKNRYIAFDKLLKLAGSNIDVMFVMQNTGDLGDFNLNDVDVSREDCGKAPSHFPIYIDVHPTDTDSYIFEVRNTDVLDPETVTSFVDSTMAIIADIMIKYDDPIVSIKYTENVGIILGNMRNLEPRTIDQAVSTYSQEITPAILYSTEEYDHLDSKMNYSDLLALSNQIARDLIGQRSVKMGDTVGVMMSRGPKFVAMLLAILKTGSAYVPIDPNYPAERIKYMVDDCKPKLVIHDRDDPVELSANMIHIKDIEKSRSQYSTDNFSLSNPDDVAYIIYTSGSTGNPKGVMVQHRSVINVLEHFRETLKVDSKSSVWNLTTMSFDIMVLEIFLPLTSGAQLMICPPCVTRNPVQLVTWINDHKPTILQATPTQFSLIGDHITPRSDLTILVGGEALTPPIAKSLLKVTDSIYNVYGPSETTVWSTVKKLTSKDDITIGLPLLNTKCVILNERMKQVPKGCVGELCIGGAGVALGYFNRHDLTNERFIEYQSERFYRTGDLVKLNSSSEIEYIGRTDFQIKIRGHRVELTEIALVMESLASVKRAVITAKQKDNQTFLIAYYTGDKDDTILEYLRARLPSFMCPNFTIHVPRFPETLNGKVDINKLPDIFDKSQKIDYVNLNNLVAPRNELEQKVHDMCAVILSLEKMSVIESFLNMGATSVTYWKFVDGIAQTFGKIITIEQFIKNSTISMLTKLIS